MGAVKGYYKESKQEDDRMYDDWKKESLKLLPPKSNPTIIEKIKQYFIKKGIKWIIKF